MDKHTKLKDIIDFDTDNLLMVDVIGNILDINFYKNDTLDDVIQDIAHDDTLLFNTVSSVSFIDIGSLDILLDISIDWCTHDVRVHKLCDLVYTCDVL